MQENVTAFVPLYVCFCLIEKQPLRNILIAMARVASSGLSAVDEVICSGDISLTLVFTLNKVNVFLKDERFLLEYGVGALSLPSYFHGK